MPPLLLAALQGGGGLLASAGGAGGLLQGAGSGIASSMNFPFLQGAAPMAPTQSAPSLPPIEYASPAQIQHIQIGGKYKRRF